MGKQNPYATTKKISGSWQSPSVKLGRADDSGEGVENISSEQLKEVMGRELNLKYLFVGYLMLR